MKKLIFLLVATLMLSSCNDWFDVAPKEEYIDENVLFRNESAFRNALNGIYTELRAADLFGSNLGLGGVEFLGQTFVPNDELKPWAEFDYNSALLKNGASQVWTAMYHAIYSCNNLLRLFEEKKNVAFVKGSKEVMMGELQVLRVAMHYELIRLFHPSYAVEPSFKGVFWKETIGEEMEQLSTRELFVKMLSQLTTAIDVLRKYDPIATKVSLDVDGIFGMTPENRLWKMNYYAALGLKARIALAMDTESGYAEARACADTVIRRGYFSFVTSAGNDLALSKECVMALASPAEGLQALSNLLFEEKGILLSPVVQATDWKASAPNDIRFKWLTADLRSLLPKYGSTSVNASGSAQPIPYMKLGEMYLIAAEATVKLNDTEGAYEYINTLVNKHFSKMVITKNSTAAEMMAEIRKQYVQEFLGEGQLFYNYKRWNLSSIPSYDGRNIEMTKAKYTWPIPVN